MFKQIKTYIRRILWESFIDDKGNLVNFDNAFDPDDIMFDYGEARRFARDMQRDIPLLGNYELVDYFPSSGEKESFTFEQNLMSGEIFNVFIDHEIVNGRSMWRLRYGSPADTKKVGDPTVTDIQFDSGDIQGYEAFVKKANQSRDRWDFDSW